MQNSTSLLFWHLFSLSLNIVLLCGAQLLNVTFSFLSARCIQLSGFVLIRVSCRCVIDEMLLDRVCFTRLIRTLITVCSASLLSASTRVRHSPAAAAGHPLEFEVSRCRMSQFAWWFLPAKIRIWYDLLYTVFDTVMLDWFKGAVNRWLLSWYLFSSVFRGADDCGVAKATYGNLLIT